MRTFLALLALALLAPLAAAAPLPPTSPVQACSDIVEPYQCSNEWLCVNAYTASRCVRDLCWNAATCYGMDVDAPSTAPVAPAWQPGAGVCIENHPPCEWDQLACVYDSTLKVCVPDIS